MLVLSSWAVLGSLLVGAADLETPRAVDPRLRIELFAAEPEIVTPTGIAVDGKGRVLVVENHTHFRPEGYQGPPADRIRMFADTDGDGRADRITTFFEGTKWTMSVAVDRDGSVLAATRYEVFRLRDTNGDGQSDQKTTLAHLETPGDYPHNGLSGFAVDIEGNIYFGMGENLGAPYKLVGSDGTSLSGGGEGGNVYRCKPDGTGLVRVATGFWNPFHLARDIHGRLFAVDNDPDSRPPCRLLHVVEGGDYGYRFRNGRKGLHPFTAWNGELPGTLPMVAGTGEAPSGLVVYESDNLPADYRGNILSTSWGDHRIERFRLKPRGASVTAVMEPVFEGGENFRPVGIVSAPDGSLYVSDWVDKSYPLHGKGRVWHVSATQPPARTTPADPAAALDHPDRRIREAAARTLAQEPSGQAAFERVLASGSERARAAALEAACGLPNLRPDVVRAALKNSSEHIRAMAVRGLPARLIDAVKLAGEDQSPEVRAEALRRIDTEAGVPLLLKALEDSDPFITLAAREGLKRTVRLPRLLELAKTDQPAQRLGILLVLRESADPEARKALPAFLDDPDLTIRFAAIQWVGEQNLGRFRGSLMEGLAQGASTRALFEAYLAALERLDGVRRLPTQEFAGEDYVARLLLDRSTAPAVLPRALRMLRPDHPALTLDRLKRWARADDLDLRLEAVRTLRESPHAGRIAVLEELARAQDISAAIRAEAIMGLPGTDADQKALLVKLAADPEPAVRHAALRSLRDLPLTPADRAALERLESSDQATWELAARLLGRAEDPPPPATTDLQGWLKRLDGWADQFEGEQVFFHPKGPGCARCHQIDGRGGRVGPDLSTTGKVLDRARLVQSILEPSKEVAPQFVTWSIQKTDGTVLSGVLVAESPLGEQTYADAQGKTFTLRASEVAARRPQHTSLMPDDLVRTMTVRELRNLIGFLRQPREGDDKTAPGNN